MIDPTRPDRARLWRALRSSAKMRGASPLEQTRDRLVVTAAAIVLLFGAITVKLADATLLTHASEAPRTIAETEPAERTAGRADIVDRRGEALASSLTVPSLFADAKAVIDPAEATRKLIQVLPDLDPIDTLSKLTSDKRFVWIKRDLTPREAAAIHNLGIPGIDFQNEERRIYPAGDLASHVVGFTDVDGNGLAGLERGLDKRLRGERDKVETTLDLRLQHIMRAELKATMDEFQALDAVGMIYDVRNGEILSMVSLPDFDPQNPTGQDANTLFNRATLGVFEMGSTFKIFNTAMVLDAGRTRITDQFDAIHNIEIGGFTIKDYHSENRMLSVAEIFEVSSNLGSVRMMQTVGPTAQKAFLTKLGMTKPMGLEVSENGWPLVPNPWREINAMTISYGHGISVSPVHVVAAAGAVVNGGVYYRPTLLKRPDGEAPQGERVISERTSQEMRKLFRLVVTEGTAKQAAVPGYVVGGKTGTADKQRGKTYAKNARMSSFVGVFPMNDPHYLVYVWLDEPQSTKKTYGFATAGWNAAPAVGRVIARAAPLLGVRPVDENAPEIRRALDIAPAGPPASSKSKGNTVAQLPTLRPDD